jgi:hypothetical protein
MFLCEHNGGMVAAMDTVDGQFCLIDQGVPSSGADLVQPPVSDHQVRADSVKLLDSSSPLEDALFTEHMYSLLAQHRTYHPDQLAS